MIPNKIKFVQNKTPEIVNQKETQNLSLKFEASFKVKEIIYFPISGKLEQGEKTLKIGSRIEKNQLLFKINNEKYFQKLISLKSNLKFILNSNFKDISDKFPKEVYKWQGFYNQISNVDFLPKEIIYNTNQEKLFFDSIEFSNVIAEINTIEQEAESYFYIAKNNGHIGSLDCVIHSKVKTNQQVATIVDIQKQELSSVISKREMEFFTKKRTQKNKIEFKSKNHESFFVNPDFQFSKIIESDSFLITFQIKNSMFKPQDSQQSFFYELR